MECWDEVSGKPLKPELVRKARQEEIAFFRRKGVYKKVPAREAYEKTGRSPIRVKWVDVNKGDEENPEYRSRLVAAELKTEQRPDLFAGTPPVEAIRLILSDAATADRETTRKCLMVNDVKRAYFHAKCTRDVYVQLPEEDTLSGEEGLCGKLELSMYGTRDAAKNWEETCRDIMLGSWGSPKESQVIAYFPLRETSAHGYPR